MTWYDVRVILIPITEYLYTRKNVSMGTQLRKLLNATRNKNNFQKYVLFSSVL